MRAKVYATDVGGKGLIHGAIEGVSGHWWQNEWNPDGREWSFTGRRESDHDLMPPAPETVNVEITFRKNGLIYRQEFDIPANCIQWPA